MPSADSLVKETFSDSFLGIEREFELADNAPVSDLLMPLLPLKGPVLQER